MVADEFAERKRKATRLVRRSTVLSFGARTLWIELLEGWCWKEPICWPSVELLAFAMGASRGSISRWTIELRKKKLLEVSRGQRGNEYILNLDIPLEVCDPARGVNTKLVALWKASLEVTKCDDPEQESCVPTSYSDDPDVTKCDMRTVLTSQKRISDVTKTHVPMMKYIKEASKEREADEGKKSAPPAEAREVTPSARDDVSGRCAPATEGSTGENEEGHKSSEMGEPEDLNGLIEDPLPMQVPRNPRKQRGPRLLALPGDGLRTAPKSRGATIYYQPDPPAPSTPDDVLALLRSEVEAKFGTNSARGLPFELTGKEKGQLKNIVLHKFSPRNVIAMIRLLVWDWEVAREVCFPPRSHSSPTIENLVQYVNELSARLATGFVYQGTKRGDVNTYSDVYLKGLDVEDDDDPY